MPPLKRSFCRGLNFVAKLVSSDNIRKWRRSRYFQLFALSPLGFNGPQCSLAGGRRPARAEQRRQRFQKLSTPSVNARNALVPGAASVELVRPDSGCVLEFTVWLRAAEN